MVDNIKFLVFLKVLNNFDMENSENGGKSGMLSSQRNRRSIFGADKPKGESEEPKILLNGDTFSDWNASKPSVFSAFFQPPSNTVSQVTITKPQPIVEEERRNTGTFFIPAENPINKVVGTNPMQTSCIRPNSVGRRSSIVFQNQAAERPVINLMTQSKNVTTVTPPTQILASSKIIPSQSNNMLASFLFNHGMNQHKRNITINGKPQQENIVVTHSPVKQQVQQFIQPMVTNLNEISRSRVIIQEDQKTITELNKLTSMNQYLSQQFTMVNNELLSMKTKTYQKEVVNDFEFLEKSQSKIDDIFIRETNHALMRLDELSRCASSKGFSRGSNSRVKRNPSPGFTRTSQQYYMTTPSQGFTPVKMVQQMQNSSYMPCDHIDPLAIYDEEA